MRAFAVVCAHPHATPTIAHGLHHAVVVLGSSIWLQEATITHAMVVLQCAQWILGMFAAWCYFTLSERLQSGLVDRGSTDNQNAWSVGLRIPHLARCRLLCTRVLVFARSDFYQRVSDA